MCFSQLVEITRNGITIVAKIVDTCIGCGPEDLGEYDKIDGLVLVGLMNCSLQTCLLVCSKYLPTSLKV
jgi:hypothetical protein